MALKGTTGNSLKRAGRSCCAWKVDSSTEEVECTTIKILYCALIVKGIGTGCRCQDGVYSVK